MAAAVAETLDTNVLEASQNQEVGIKGLLEARWSEGKFLCVGLDVSPDGDSNPQALYRKARLIVEATQDIAAAYKPNSAFYEGHGSEGVAQLERLVGFIKQSAPHVPVIWDAKRADIANTNEGYDKVRTALKADAITVHPYLGGSAVKPLLSNKTSAGFVLAHTSNPGAGEFQHLELKTGELLWEKVVKNVAHTAAWQYGSPLGIVAGATYPEELARARYLAGDDIIMLVPGVGAQGGDLDASVRGAMNSHGNGFLINVSSGISGATDAHGKVTRDSIREAAIKYHEQIHEVWREALDNPKPNYATRAISEFDQKLAVALYDQDCIMFGRFALRSGAISPVYVNLRNTISDPKLRGNIANIYIDLITGLEEVRDKPFDILAGIPQAATSYAAIVADRMNRRLIQIRVGGKKSHGVATAIDGIYKEGEEVGLIDDLISDGGAKFDTINDLQKAGLKFGGLALLLDREQGGFREMARRGYPISAATTLRSLIIALEKAGKISNQRKNSTLAYLQQ